MYLTRLLMGQKNPASDEPQTSAEKALEDAIAKMSDEARAAYFKIATMQMLNTMRG